MFPLISIYPATCELCGQWMPEHRADCPRSGVHPSQWSNSFDDEILSATEITEIYVILQGYDTEIM